MATDAQINANRANAQQSTGPGVSDGVSLIRHLRYFPQGDGALRPLRTRLSDPATTPPSPTPFGSSFRRHRQLSSIISMPWRLIPVPLHSRWDHRPANRNFCGDAKLMASPISQSSRSTFLLRLLPPIPIPAVRPIH
jgi:hypothetical protein